MKNLYEILEIHEKATKDDIKKAFRKKAKQYHPDMKNGNSKEFIEISKAYRILSDDSKRAKYDETGEIPEDVDIESAAWALLCDYLIKTTSSQFIDLEKIDVVKNIRELCLLEKRKIKFNLMEIQKSLDRLSIVKRRLKSNRGNNILSLSIDHEIRRINNILKSYETKILYINKAIEFLKNYRYDLSEFENEF